ncbi:MAG TPA: hypothetical protein VJ023_01690 [Pyrinomonadaceae bacterium]|nr:hypothetical protein [Pyrinomonadaceae bacterium]
MAPKKDQHKAGIPTKPRGQQTGFAGNPDQNRQSMDETPALSGRRKLANKFFSDKSRQNETGDSVTRRSNHPSTPAMNSAIKKGESGGERVFKRRLAQKRQS